MKRLLILLALLLPVAAFAAPRTAFQIRCEDTISKTVSVLSAKQNGYSVNTQLSYKQLTAMKGVASANAYVLGLTRTESRVQIATNGPILQDRASGYECIAPQIIVELTYAPVKVYVGREFPQGTCGYDVILAHEMRHMQTYMDHLPRAEKIVREALARRFGGKPLYAPAGTAQSALAHEINSGWLAFIKAEMAKVEQLQAAIDTPAEYARLGKMCGGEIQRVFEQNTPPRRQIRMSKQDKRHIALIPAAGVGARMAAGSPKQYLPIAGKPMLRYAVEAFQRCELIAHTYVVVSAGDAYIGDVLPAGEPGVTVLRCGGETRMDSILNGLRAARAQIGDDDLVLVHDAARPGLTPGLIRKLIAEAGGEPAGGLLALPVVDTVKSTRGGAVVTTPRDGLWLAQTPQMFPYALLERALGVAADPSAITDDASAIEALGLSPKLVEGHPRNFKVTLPSDIGIAEMYLRQDLA